MEAAKNIGCPPLLDHVCVCGKRNCGKLKYLQPLMRKSCKPDNVCHKSNVSMCNETITKLSYPNPHGFQSSESFKPKAILHRYDFPIGGDTTHSLSYAKPVLPLKEQYPWAMRRYVPSNVKMSNDTIQKLSYMPPGEFVQVDGCNCGYSGQCLNN